VIKHLFIFTVKAFVVLFVLMTILNIIANIAH
jgi:hypothetical protein